MDVSSTGGCKAPSAPESVRRIQLSDLSLGFQQKRIDSLGWRPSALSMASFGRPSFDLFRIHFSRSRPKGGGWEEYEFWGEFWGVDGREVMSCKI